MVCRFWGSELGKGSDCSQETAVYHLISQQEILQSTIFKVRFKVDILLIMGTFLT